MTQTDFNHLLDLIYRLLNAHDPDRVLEELIRDVLDLFDAEGSSIALIDADRKKLNFFLQAGESKRPSFQVNMGVGVAGRVAQTGELICVNDVQTSPLFYGKIDQKSGFTTRSILCAPIWKEEEVIGTLQVLNKCNHQDFTLDDQERLKILSRFSGVALSRSQERQRLNTLESLAIIELSSRYNLVQSQSKQMNKQLGILKQVAQAHSTVLILGESGVGKEIAARALHQWSSRDQQHFVAVNCTAISPQLLESEFFGHEKGAFTGATGRKKGRFEMAHKGTLFLDEIGDLSLDLQTKLLRVLQDKEFQRVGGTELIYSDFRLVAATNRNLKERIQQGLFREDLYYRLNVISVHLPPLRERKIDIPSLSQYFVHTIAKSLKRSPPKMSADFLHVLSQYHWPGNIRELANLIERSVVLCIDGILKPSLLPVELQQTSSSQEEFNQSTSTQEHSKTTRQTHLHSLTQGPDSSSSISVTLDFDPQDSLRDQVRSFKRHVIETTLQKNRYHQEKTAQALGIKASNLSRLMKDLGLRS